MKKQRRIVLVALGAIMLLAIVTSITFLLMRESFDPYESRDQALYIDGYTGGMLQGIMSEDMPYGTMISRDGLIIEYARGYVVSKRAIADKTLFDELVTLANQVDDSDNSKPGPVMSTIMGMESEVACEGGSTREIVYSATRQDWKVLAVTEGCGAPEVNSSEEAIEIRRIVRQIKDK